VVAVIPENCRHHRHKILMIFDVQNVMIYAEWIQMEIIHQLTVLTVEKSVYQIVKNLLEDETNMYLNERTVGYNYADCKKMCE
jgi:hypothetical protein